MTRPTPHTVWYHPKTDSTYIVLAVALCSTNGPGEYTTEAVVYMSLNDAARLYYREIGEFTDGRFVQWRPQPRPVP